MAAGGGKGGGAGGGVKSEREGDKGRGVYALYGALKFHLSEE